MRDLRPAVVHLPSGRKGVVAQDTGGDQVLVRWESGHVGWVDREELKSL